MTSLTSRDIGGDGLLMTAIIGKNSVREYLVSSAGIDVHFQALETDQVSWSSPRSSSAPLLQRPRSG
jgi:hypothetical protein